MQIPNIQNSKYYLSIGITENYNVIINGKKFYDHVIHFDIKWHNKIRKITTRLDEGCTTKCLLDYDFTSLYIGRNFADQKAIKQIEFLGQL